MKKTGKGSRVVRRRTLDIDRAAERSAAGLNIAGPSASAAWSLGDNEGDRFRFDLIQNNGAPRIEDGCAMCEQRTRWQPPRIFVRRAQSSGPGGITCAGTEIAAARAFGREALCWNDDLMGRARWDATG